MAGEFNLYSQYAQTQAPISQFVPDNIPWELILKQGVQKQAMQDFNIATIKKAAADFDPYAYHANDAKYNQEIDKKIKAIVEESYNKDYSSSAHAADDVINKITALKEDEGVKAAAAHTEWRKNLDKLATEYAKNAELAPENFYRDFAASKEYGERQDISLDRNYFGNIDNAKGIDIQKAAKEHMGTIAASDSAFAAKKEGIGYTMKTKAITSDDISRVAGAGFDIWVNSAAGQQLSNRFDMYKESGNPFMTTKYKEVIKKDKNGKNVKTYVADGQRELTKGEYLFNTLTGAVENQKFKSTDASDFVQKQKEERDYQRALAKEEREKVSSEALKIFRPGTTTVPMSWLKGIYSTNDDGSFNVNAGNVLVGPGTLTNYSEKELRDFAAATAYKNVDSKTAASKTKLEEIKEARSRATAIMSQFGLSHADFKLSRKEFNEKHLGIGYTGHSADEIYTTYWLEQAKWNKEESEAKKLIKDLENKTYAKYGVSRAQALTSEGYKKSQKQNDSAVKLPESLMNVKSKFTPSTDKAITVDGTKYLHGTFTLTEEEFSKISDTDKFDAKNYIQEKTDDKGNVHYTVNGYLPLNNDITTLTAIDKNVLGETYDKNQSHINMEYAIDAQDRYNKSVYESVTYNRNFNYLMNEGANIAQVQSFFNTDSTLTATQEQALLSLLKDPNASLEDKSLVWDLTHNKGTSSVTANGQKIDLIQLAEALTKNKK